MKSRAAISFVVSPPAIIFRTSRSRVDSADIYLKSLRDLEDFSRLWITFKGITELVKSGGVTVQLEWKPMDGGTSWPGDAGNPAINVFKAVETDGGNKYLSDEATAKSQVSYGNTPTEYSISVGRVGRGQPLTLPATLLATLSESQPNMFLLFEGAGEGKGQLVLTLQKDGQKIGEYPPLYLDLKNVKKMYQRAKATPDAGFDAPYESASNPTSPNVSWVEDENGNAFTKPPDESKQAVVFVHGWNVSYDDALSSADTMFKRLWWQGYKGRFSAFRWPTLVGVTTFNTSEHRAFKYASALKQYVETLPSGYTRNITAHSMGNTVTGEALRMGMQINNYVLMEAAIPAGCYDDSQTINSYPRFLKQ